MKSGNLSRHWAETTCSVGLIAVLAAGCNSSHPSFASLNPFSKSNDAAVAAATEPTEPATGRLATMGQTVSGQVNSLGMATASAWGKTKAGVSRAFNAATEVVGGEVPAAVAETDPTNLSSPTNISPEVLVANGAFHETSGDQARAMECYRKALKIEPTNGAALASLARLHARQQNHSEAVVVFEQAIAVNPNEPSLYNDLALSLAKTGNLQAADQAMSRAVAISSGQSRFANNLANIRYDAGDIDGALAILIEHNKPAVAHYNMASLHFRSGNYVGARTHLQEAIRHEPSAAGDGTTAQAVARSRAMLAQLDSGATRVAQAGSGVLAAASQAANVLANPTGGAASISSGAQTAPWVWGTPTAPATPDGAGMVTPPPPATSSPATGSEPSQPFTLPPGAFDEILR